MRYGVQWFKRGVLLQRGATLEDAKAIAEDWSRRNDWRRIYVTDTALWNKGLDGVIGQFDGQHGYVSLIPGE